MKVIGMMSGTSFDAIDAACADISVEGDRITLRPLGMVSSAYPDELIAELNRALPPGQLDMHTQCRLDTGIGQAFAGLAAHADRMLAGGEATLVAVHGQTVFHWVEEGQVKGTLQIGNPAFIAEATGKPVISDFRSRDVAAGGQGAPLVSALDVMWLRDQGHCPAALNLGGIANVTIVPQEGEAIAFDTGPANALLDAAMVHFSNGELSHDFNGEWASRGRVDTDFLNELLSEPYFSRSAPKTTGKELFNPLYLHSALLKRPDLEPCDVLATLTALTAHSIADALAAWQVDVLVAAGGGTRNPVLMSMLKEALPGVQVKESAALGLPAQAKEAYAFALLGFLSWHGLPGTVPSCTGARGSRVLGSITPGAMPLRLPEPLPQQGLFHLSIAAD